MSDLHRTRVPAKAMDPAARRSKRAYNALSASSVGLELGVAVVVGLLFGMWLDTRLGTSPWLMLLFLVFGLVAGFRNVLRAVARAEKAAEDEAREDGLHVTSERGRDVRDQNLAPPFRNPGAGGSAEKAGEP